MAQIICIYMVCAVGSHVLVLICGPCALCTLNRGVQCSGTVSVLTTQICKMCLVMAGLMDV